jgi:ABC-2 type transport system permease protein
VSAIPAPPGPWNWLRPYRAAFGSRFTTMLQYRSAALAGFVTQCWWGGLKIMILAAFYTSLEPSAAPPISLADAITYTWVSQGLFALLPWMADPEVAAAVRSGGIAYDRLRPVDAYALWYARAAGWLAARVLPRVLLMLSFAAVLLPMVGLTAWSWPPPSSFTAGALFTLSLVLALLLSAAILMLISATVVTLRDERGIVALVGSVVVVLSGNLLPLSLFPDALGTALLLQPLAGLLDIPLRIYLDELSGAAALAGLGLQLVWTLVLIVLGRAALGRALRGLEIQGG